MSEDARGIEDALRQMESATMELLAMRRGLIEFNDGLFFEAFCRRINGFDLLILEAWD